MKFNYIIILSITTLLVSCGTPAKKINSTPESQLKNHNGKAVITEIIDAKNSSGSDSRGYLEVYFNFIPADTHAAETYLCSVCSDKKIKLIYDNRESFHKNWLNKWEIQPGSEYPAIRHELMRNDNTSAVSYEVFLVPKK